jgi:DNA-3-methyladenine glycosylase
MRKVLNQNFFNRDAEIVAKELLGKFLVRNIGRKEIASMITETEAYVGPHDLASHAAKGLTERTKIMFGHPGHFYVYLIYGMYLMLNIVAREKGYPAAVLIRGLAEATGPGKAGKFLKITKGLNGKPAEKRTGLWIEDRGIRVPKNRIKKTPRIGVDYAGPVWSKKKLRFLITHVS